MLQASHEMGEVNLFVCFEDKVELAVTTSTDELQIRHQRITIGADVKVVRILALYPKVKEKPSPNL